ncbi:hypothetical protein SAMN06297229_2370 [Pseudidiomarina planktonica]|uniref:Uncharacterized protein n=1 Tax=Pseudidiomarina planktonica TaxID=1323738 RepID=A0A1Y6FYH2_9GAMM|nr:hypothetical protein [Pseudidiomarina planktonica]RUO62865.1 hypothetical protein CWI77_11775 [Pseudidiomarina planktonica]SMQ80748.1 hypothetical protein SAMN06297229_2370 [Pseudidiomarina planktonica]
MKAITTTAAALILMSFTATSNANEVVTKQSILSDIATAITVQVAAVTADSVTSAKNALQETIVQWYQPTEEAQLATTVVTKRTPGVSE